MIDKDTKKPKIIPVPILEPKNLGRNMTIDDKNLKKEGYTIISNKDTGKIFLMIMTRKAKIICDTILDNVSFKLLLKVKNITKDLASGYDWVARICFMNAVKIADKFHVISLGLSSLQAVRIRLRQAMLTAERKAKEEKDKKKKEKNKKEFKNTILSNGETVKELLARSRYLLFKFKKEWTDTQRERAIILFKLYPEIKESYSLICQFRSFYKTKIGRTKQAEYLLHQWYKQVDASSIDEIKNFASTVKKHEGEILTYFYEGQTNAFAESLNAKLQRFLIASYGFRHRNFFHFRIKKHFS